MYVPVFYVLCFWLSIFYRTALARIQLAAVHTDDTHRSRFSVECRDACDKRGWGNVIMSREQATKSIFIHSVSYNKRLTSRKVELIL